MNIDLQHQTLCGFAWMNFSPADFLEDNGSKVTPGGLEISVSLPQTRHHKN
jgi:hypothetical protein